MLFLPLVCRRRFILAVLAGALLPLAARAAPADGEFRSLFNGRDLTGWDGNPELWSVEDGVIVGRTRDERQLDYNQFLIWRGGEVTDFELRATVRQSGNNSGIQYRSHEYTEAGPWALTGYQLDIHPIQANNGQLYEERGRRLMGRNGHRVVVGPDGAKWLVEEKAPLTTDVTQWNEYTIIARGNRIVHQINGRTVYELLDCEPGKRSLAGLLAFQIHRGPPMTVEIKDVALKALPATAASPFEPSLVPPGTGQVKMPN